MRARVGIAFGSDAVRAVVVRKRQIVWTAEAGLEPGAPLQPVVESLLRLAPVGRLPRPVLSAVVGPHGSQLKVLTGLPDVEDADTLGALVRENAGSFFLRNGVPLVTSCTGAGGSAVLGGAIEEPFVGTVRRLCKRLGWRQGLIAPTAAVLGQVLTDDCFVWADGSLLLEVTRSGGAIESVRTRWRADSDSVAAEPIPVAALAALGEAAVRYADAYAAATLKVGMRIGAGVAGPAGWSASEAKKRLLSPGLVLALGLGSLLVSPLAALWVGGRARAALAAVRAEQQHVVASTLARLDSVSTILSGVQRFADSRAFMTSVVGQLAETLPENCVLVALEVTDRGGSLEALCANPTEVLMAVRDLSDARAVELVGPVNREVFVGREVQRMTVRWRRGGS